MVHYNEQCRVFEYITLGAVLICFTMADLQRQVKDIYGVDIRTLLN